jgi:hypothetical protein
MRYPRIKQVHATTASNGDERICFRRLAICFDWLEMHSNQSADDFEVAEFFRPDVEQEVSAPKIIHAVLTLNGILHRRR